MKRHRYSTCAVLALALGAYFALALVTQHPTAALEFIDDEAKDTITSMGEFPFAELKLKSPAQIEKVVGKKNFGPFADLVTKVSSGTNLVSEKDARPAVKTAGALDFVD